MNESSLRSGNDDKKRRVRVAVVVERIVREFLSPSSAGFGTMNSRLTALLFALFLCHEACADCFVVDLLEYSAPGEMQGHAYDTFCYRDTLAYSTSIEIEERYFGKARRKGASLAVWYDSADYEGVIPAPDTLTYVRHNDTLSWVVPSKDTADRTVHFVRVDVSDESIPFFSGRGDETIGRCETLKKKRRKSSRLKSV